MKQNFLIIVVLIFSLKMFQSTPFEKIFFQMQGGFLFLILLFIIGYILNVLFHNVRMNRIIFYYMLLIGVIPIYSAFRAVNEFSQPFIYGFLSERTWLLIGVGIWFYYLLNTKKITFKTLESSFVFMAWASLLIYTFFVLILDPTQFQNADEVSKFILVGETRGLRFNFQNYFITFGVIYYFIKYLMKRNSYDLFAFFFFLTYILIVVQGRMYMIFLGITFLLYYVFNYTISRFTMIMIKLFLLFISLLIVLQMFLPEYLERMGFLFSQMFEVIMGNESEDASANARIFQSIIVSNYFELHPWSLLFGTGSVSHQWNDGYNSIFGYFYPWDIGALGGIFIYGLIGLLFIYIIPLIISFKIVKSASTTNVFVRTLKYILIYYMVGSIQGGYYFDFIAYIIPLFILLAYSRNNLSHADNN